MGKFKFMERAALEVSKKMGLTGLKIKAKAPEILLGAGIVSMFGGVLSSVSAARQLDEILDEHNEELDAAKAEVVVDEEGKETVKDQKEINRQVRKVYSKTGRKVLKAFALTGALMALSTACFVGMHNIQAGRIAGLTSAYTGLKEAFEEYQRRNIELNGEENHQMCKYGWKEMDEVDENGNRVVKKKVAKDIRDLEEDGSVSAGHCVWGRSCPSFTGDHTYDSMILVNAQRHIEDLVKIRGWAIENDARDALQLPRTTEGMINGWVRGFGEAPSFGIEDPVNQLFNDGHEYHSVVLTFNTQGNVFHLLNAIKSGSKEV